MRDKWSNYDKSRKSRTDILLKFIIGLLFAVGVGLLAYPTVASKYNEWHSSYLIASYEDKSADLSDLDYARIMAGAVAYNQVLPSYVYRWTPNQELHDWYSSLLNVTDTGVMCYVSIPSIKIKLPVYHGTDEKTLALGVGHMEGSSLPVGGIGTHAVMSGHSALPSARLFTDLSNITTGDLFYIHVLDRILTYRVVDIETVLPDDFSHFEIDPEKDMCTLVTCTPYGVNTHRLLVIGERLLD